MFTIAKNHLLLIVLAVFCFVGHAQDEEVIQEDNSFPFYKIEFYNLRGTNVIDGGVGLALINSDYPDPEIDMHLRIGFKHYFTESLNVNLSFNRYNLAFNETFHQGFMSFDFNLEYLILPCDELSPFIYAGYGYNTTTDFENSQPKVQAGLGVEYLLFDKVGVKLYGEFNYALSNEMEGLIVPDNDEYFIRAGIGINYYFGGEKRKNRLMENIETVINSNLLE
ncbi:porin family protein [Winogradskyella tangerina]|uniref:Curli production assembly/transport component CsgG n=1 Tax=Winogradskyella tangerina TaxID=2023240 RepID=UPI000DBE0C3B|nr:Curli production assembly/transport component CsgG [Winogradskyella tangerina]